jgi:hypothetical protein
MFLGGGGIREHSDGKWCGTLSFFRYCYCSPISIAFSPSGLTLDHDARRVAALYLTGTSGLTCSTLAGSIVPPKSPLAAKPSWPFC